MTAIAAAMDLGVLRYGQVWEDHRLVEIALRVGPGDDVLVVGSAGCNALSLLLQGPRSVTAVDVSPAQTALLDLKVVAIRRLSYAEWVRFLGYRDAADRLPLYDRLRAAMPAEAREYWDDRPAEIDAGVVHAGRLERYFRAFQDEQLQRILPHGVVRRLFEAGTLAEQRAWFYREIATPELESAFRDWFGRERMAAEGRDPAQLRWVEEPDVGGHFWRRFERVATAIPARTNPYLEWFLTSRLGDLETAPPPVTRAGFAALRPRLGRLRVVTASLEEVLDAAPPGAFSRAALSDVCEYLSPEETAGLLSGAARAIRPGGRLCRWDLLVPRPRPAALADRLRPLWDLARRLHARDRSWFYRDFHVEEVLR